MYLCTIIHAMQPFGDCWGVHKYVYDDCFKSVKIPSRDLRKTPVGLAPEAWEKVKEYFDNWVLTFNILIEIKYLEIYVKCIVNLFESGVLSAEAAILQLKAYKTYDQLSFHTAKTIGTLRFVESIEV